MKTIKLKLFSLNKEEYPDTEVDCIVVEDMPTFMKEYVESKVELGVLPKVAQKTALISARVGHVGEVVDTRVRISKNGKMYVIGETLNKVTVEDSMIVKNPDGEEYILKPEKFASRYEKTENGLYRPLSDPIKYIIMDKDIAFMAPWGEQMFAVSGAAINISSENEIYAIQNEAFKSTYMNI